MTEHRPTPPPPPPPPVPYPNYGQLPRAKRPAWFWIAIVGGCFALLIPVLLIVAAVAIPSMLSVKKRANQASAIQTIRTITSAEITYQASYPDNGFACSLPNLGGDPASGPATAQAAQLIEPGLATNASKNGYAFTITCGSNVTVNNHEVHTSYNVTAVPEQIGKTGDTGYCADENDVIKIDPTGGTNCSQPIP